MSSLERQPFTYRQFEKKTGAPAGKTTQKEGKKPVLECEPLDHYAYNALHVLQFHALARYTQIQVLVFRWETLVWILTLTPHLPSHPLAIGQCL